MTELLAPTAPNFRAERGRYLLDNADLVAAGAGPSTQLVAMYLSGYRKITPRTRAAMATAFNQLVGRELFATTLTAGETDQIPGHA